MRWLSAIIVFILGVWEAAAMEISSPAFTDHGMMPSRFTCEGEDVSPELVIRGVPADAKSLALIVDDPDAPDPAAPRMIWTHWVLYNLPPDTTTIPEGARPGHGLPASVREGRNDWGEPGYRGPCPPIGRHRYFFRVYALDTMLSDLRLPTRAKLLQAIEGHVLDQAELVGLYEKQR